jgi:hypothetical protein
MTASTPGTATGFDHTSTLVAAIEISDKSWVIGAHVPGLLIPTMSLGHSEIMSLAVPT